MCHTTFVALASCCHDRWMDTWPDVMEAGVVHKEESVLLLTILLQPGMMQSVMLSCVHTFNVRSTNNRTVGGWPWYIRFGGRRRPPAMSLNVVRRGARHALVGPEDHGAMVARQDVKPLYKN